MFRGLQAFATRIVNTLANKRAFHQPSTIMSPTSPRIAVIGGGPGGLSLSLLLHKNKIPFTLFEFRPKPTAEEIALPSGMLDLHDESGLTVIRECGLWDEFVPLIGECAEVNVVTDQKGKVLYTEAEGYDSLNASRDRPEISRNNLSTLLMSKVPDDSIKWDHKLLSATKSSSTTENHATTTELDFGPHGKDTFDLVIGADGAWSRVRRMLTDDWKPSYSGKQIITLTIKHISTNHPHLASFIGPGTFSAMGNHHAIMSQRGPLDSARIYIYFSTPVEDYATASGLADKSPSAAKEQILGDPELLAGFEGLVRNLVEVGFDEEAREGGNDPKLDIRPLYTLPYGLSWTPNPSATLLGDAAHLMLPNGEGVNAAMLDAFHLSKAIVEAHESNKSDAAGFQKALAPLLRGYEEEMNKRAVVMGEETDQLLGIMFGDDAANDFANFFITMGEQMKAAMAAAAADGGSAKE